MSVLVLLASAGLLPGLGQAWAAAPVATGGSTSLGEDTSTTLTLTASDADGDTLTYSVVTAPAHGSVALTGNSALYTPAANFFGTDSFTFRARDTTGAYSNVATINITVNGVNDPPTATVQSVYVPRNGSGTINLQGADADGDALTCAVVTGPGHGSATEGSECVVTYRPTRLYSGADSFTFTVSDGRATSAAATVSITVGLTNRAPVATNVSTSTNEDTAKTFALTASDSNGDALTYSLVTAPTHGTVTISGSNATYTPAADFNGTDSFTWQANDGRGGVSNTATATISVAAVNDAPVVTEQSVTATTAVASSVALTATDVDSTTFTWAITGNPTNGTATVSGSTLTYTSNASFTGTDRVTVRASDGSLTDTGTITFDVRASNTAPTATNVSTTTTEDTAKRFSLTASDADGDSLSYVLYSAPTYGTVTIHGRYATYTPNTNWAGTDTFRWRAYDGTSYSNVATATISVSSVDDPPVATAGSGTTNEDTVASFRVSGTDVDSRGVLTYALSTSPAHGRALLTGTSVSYTPDENFNGTDSFQFIVSDGVSNSAPATFSITVNPVNDAPLAPRITAHTVEGSSIVIRVTGYDADGNSLSFASDTSPAHGSVASMGSGFRYTPTPSYVGADRFTFHLNDGTANSATATIHVNVNPVSWHTRADMVQVGVNKVQFGRDATDPNDLETASYAFRPSTIRGWLTDLGLQAHRQATHGDVVWPAFEPIDDSFFYAGPDEILADEYFEPLATLFDIQYASPTPPWCTDPAQFQKRMNSSSYDYVNEAIGTYGGWVQYWELGNEMWHWVAADPPASEDAIADMPACYPLDGFSPGEQGGFLKQAGDHIHSLDPNAMIVLPAIRTNGDATDTWLRQVVAATGDTDWFDVMNYHSYDAWSIFYAKRDSLDRLIVENGLEDKLVHLTEAGSSSDPAETGRTNYPNSDETECSDVFRFFAISMSHGDARYIWHTLIGMSTDGSSDGLPGMELIENDGTWKPAAYTMQLLTSYMLPLAQLTDLTRGTLYAFQGYTTRGSQRWIVWSASSDEFTIPSGVTRMTSVYPGADGSFTWTTVAEGDVITLDETPVLLR